VPFVIAAPGAKGNGHPCNHVVEDLGLYRTLCELCGLPPPAGLEGKSLAPLLNDPAASWDDTAFSVSGNNGKLLGTAVRTDRFRYVEYESGGAMLFDESSDPAEMKNLADDPRVAREKSELARMADDFRRAPAPRAAGAQPPTAPPARHLPNQGAFRNGQAMFDWLGGAGDIWWDGGNPISTASAVHTFVTGGNTDAMKHPRPAKVKLYMQGNVPRLPGFTYEQAAAGNEKFRQAWIAIARECVQASYTGCVFGASELQKKTSKGPTAEEIKRGYWRGAWINMADAVRTVMPDAKFAFVPMSGGQGTNHDPTNGILEKDQWYVAGKDSHGRPYMDFWGCTLYFGTQYIGVSAKQKETVTREMIDQAMDILRKPSASPHTDWGYMGNYQYAREKGIKMVLGEIGIFDRFKDDRPFGMGDQPYAIDKFAQLLADHADQIELVCWFNSKAKEGGKKVWSRLDAESSMPNAAKRVRELWGPDSPYRK